MHDFHIVIAENDRLIKWLDNFNQSSLYGNNDYSWGVVNDHITADEVFARYKESTRFKGSEEEVDVEDFDSWVPRKTLIKAKHLDHPLIERIKGQAASITIITVENNSDPRVIFYLPDDKVKDGAIPGFFEMEIITDPIQNLYAANVFEKDWHIVLDVEDIKLALENNEVIVNRQHLESGKEEYFIKGYCTIDDSIPSCFRNYPTETLKTEEGYIYSIVSLRELIKEKGFRVDRWKQQIILDYLSASKDNTVDLEMITKIALKDKKATTKEFWREYFKQINVVWNRVFQ